MKRNIPNLLTITRLVLIPIFVIIFLLQSPTSNIIACLIFLFACLTDWIDGYLARKLNQVSLFGAFLDPVADKLLVTVALLLLTTKYNNNLIILICTIIIIGREITVSALREWMAEKGKRAKISVSYIGKLKTTFQMIAISILLAFSHEHTIIIYLGYFILTIATILTVWSMTIYLITTKSFWKL